VGFDRAAEPGERPAPLGRRGPAPVPGERRLGRGDRGVDLGGPAAGDMGEGLAGGGVLRRQRARLRRNPAVADQAEGGV